MQLRFDLAGSTVFAEAVKNWLRALSGRRPTDDGAILIIARNHSTQEQNRREAFARLADLIRRALVAPKTRKATQPTRDRASGDWRARLTNSGPNSGAAGSGGQLTREGLLSHDRSPRHRLASAPVVSETLKSARTMQFLEITDKRDPAGQSADHRIR